MANEEMSKEKHDMERKHERALAVQGSSGAVMSALHSFKAAGARARRGSSSAGGATLLNPMGSVRGKGGAGASKKTFGALKVGGRASVGGSLMAGGQVGAGGPAAGEGSGTVSRRGLQRKGSQRLTSFGAGIRAKAGGSAEPLSDGARVGDTGKASESDA